MMLNLLAQLTFPEYFTLVFSRFHIDGDQIKDNFKYIKKKKEGE